MYVVLHVYEDSRLHPMVVGGGGSLSWLTSLVMYVASGPHTSPITEDDRKGRPLDKGGLCNKHHILTIFNRLSKGVTLRRKNITTKKEVYMGKT